MTSEVEALKTNEFLRRRKLRLQQVREQSKDIAKQIRQRATDEKLRHIGHLDFKKENEYIQRQEKLVRYLEHLHGSGIKNVGAGHSKASEVTLIDEVPVDLSKIRGKEATYLQRQAKQQKLDEQKRLLERKLQARVSANVLSRDKSKTRINNNQLQSKKSESKSSDAAEKESTPNIVDTNDVNCKGDNANKPPAVTKSDMATQWTYEGLPNEWDPTSDAKQDDKHKAKGSTSTDNVDKLKKPNLFAVSEDMPFYSSAVHAQVVQHNGDMNKSSLTLVSEYLQRKHMNLRVQETVRPRKDDDDLQNIRRTISQAKCLNPPGNLVCTVHDEQVIPVPSWRPEECAFCVNPEDPNNAKNLRNRHSNITMKQDASVILLPSPVSKDLLRTDDSYYVASPRPVLRGSSPFRRNNVLMRIQDQVSNHKYIKINLPESGMNSKNSEISDNKIPVTVYNHSTRDSRYVKGGEENVIRDELTDTDAYSQALKEVTEHRSREGNGKAQQLRNKVAVTKHNIEKEYQDTMAFLKSLPKEKQSTTSKRAFMTEHRQQSAHDQRQREMQKAYQKIQIQSKRNSKMSNHTGERNNRSGSISPNNDSELVSETQDPYSWMPVPERDASLAIHTIPVTTKESKSSKGVKFSQVDSYHEYRSRHRHTPPTKDTASVKRIVIESSESTSSESSTLLSIPDDDIANKADDKGRKSDSEGIIIYKIIDSKTELIRRKKRHKEKKRAKGKSDVQSSADEKAAPPVKKSEVSTVDELKEGVYKTVSERDSVSSINYGTSKNSSSQVVTGIKDLHWNAEDKDAQESQHRYETPSCSEMCACGCQSRKIDPPEASKTSVNKPTDDAGYIKVLDQDGLESGKLFIGNTNFLNSDSYEVVIQLRKKDGTKTDRESVKESVEDKIADEVPHDVRVSGSQSKYVTPAVSPLSSDQDVSTHAVPSQTVSAPQGLINRQQPESSDPQDTNLNTNATSLDGQLNQTPQDKVRIRSSTSTQTSFDAGLRRQVIIQGSSSASTSYMSPPDKIRPIYFNPDFVGTKVAEYFNVEEPEENVHRKICRKTRQQRKGDEMISNIISIVDHECRPVKESHVSKHSKRHRDSYKRASHKQAYESYHLSHQTKRNLKQSHSKLNPILQNYVKKLLNLSKESLKAIEVNNQECSSVTTPSGSIINIPGNYDKGKKDTDFKISLGQIKDMLQQLIAENTIKAPAQKSGAKYVINNRKKVKSIYISKNFKTSTESQDKQNKCPIRIKSPVKETSSSSISIKSSKSDRKRPIVTPKKKTVYSNKQTENTDEKKITGSRARDSITGKKSTSKSNHDSTETSTSDIHGSVNKKNVSRRSTTNKSQEHIKLSTVNKPGADGDITNDSVNKKTKVCKRSKVHKHHDLSTISTQTIAGVDGDLVKLTETKIQNMEKIADLTEKCTNRLSNLAKVLQEVRKNKSAAYGHISNSDSSTEDLKSKAMKPKSSSTKIDDNSNIIQRSSPVNNKASKDSLKIPSVLQGLPKPSEFLTSTNQSSNEKSDSDIKIRRKPPAAASLLKHEFIVPHELSTVVEVDSPISLISKGRSAQTDGKSVSSDTSPKSKNGNEPNIPDRLTENFSPQPIKHANPDLLDLKVSHRRESTKDDAMSRDIEKFKDIILKPFVSIEEYAKQCNVKVLEDGSKIEDLPKENVMGNDELSSMHSEGSLPDVIGELLKRKIITKPFEFESVSNINSTTASTESSFSGLALSKIQKEKKLPNVGLESSDSLSLSSNAELETAFKNLGMNWASSTLKKTKERLALSSSSNTSNSSASLKFKSSVVKQESLPIDMKKPQVTKENDKSQTVNQQTSLASLTVKQFLDKELANKITFSKSHDESEPEFISLYETKMPEDMKDAAVMREGRSIDDMSNQRARTSTPVQLFKSAAYHSSGSSNTNDLFLDDLSSVKVTSGSVHHSTSDKDDLTIPSYSLKLKKSSDS